MPGVTNKLDVLADEEAGANYTGKEPISELANESTEDHIDHDNSDFACGGFGFHPAFLKPLGNRHMFVVFFCLKNIFQAMVFTYLVGVQTSLERHFHFNSQQTGLLPSIGEIGPLLTAVGMSYLAGHGNRPRWMGLGMYIVCVGMIIGVMAYLVFDYPEIRDNTEASRRLCSAEDSVHQLLTSSSSSLGSLGPEYSIAAGGNSSGNISDISIKKELGECTIDVGSSNAAYFLWSLVYILMATGSQTIYIVSAPYMDDGVSQKNSPLFFALAGTARILGPIMGYMLASSCISYYVDPSVDPGITKFDQRWIGAWWIGLLVIAGVLFLYGWLISLFPKRLSTEHLPLAEQKIRNQHSNTKLSRRDFIAQLLRISRNPVLVGCILSNCAYLTALLGFFAYQPKYLEHQFRVDKATATTYSAISKVTLVFGIMGSGLVLRRFRPSGRLVAGVIVLFRLAGALLFLFNMWSSCSYSDLPGHVTAKGLEIGSSCSAACGCTTEEYIPVCYRADDQSFQSYFSPCHAGCVTVSNLTDGSTTYTDCRCLDDPGVELTAGLCMGSCDSAFHWFLAITALSGFLTSAVSIPHIIILLRCVLPEDKAMALGLGSAITALAFGAGPLIMGSLVDFCCLVWEQSCGETGACWVYDPDLLRYILVGFYVGFVFLSILADSFVFIHAKNLKLYSEEEESSENKKENGTELTYQNGTENHK